MANKRAADEQWQEQWDQKKKNFQLEQELKKQEQKINDLEFRLKEEEKLKSKNDQASGERSRILLYTFVKTTSKKPNARIPKKCKQEIKGIAVNGEQCD